METNTYTPEQKLNYEVEKLKAEVIVLKQPWRQPAFWLGIVGLTASLSLNFFQLFTSSYKVEKAQFELAKAQADRELQERKRDEAMNQTQQSLDELNRINSQIAALRSQESNPEKIETLNKIQQSLDDLEQKTENSKVNLNTPESSRADEFKKARDIAKTKEREGFQSLVDGNFEAALVAFEAAESALNGYNNVHELGKLLRKNRSQLNDQNKKKELLKIIVNDLSWRAPQDLLQQLKSKTKA